MSAIRAPTRARRFFCSGGLPGEARSRRGGRAPREAAPPHAGRSAAACGARAAATAPIAGWARARGSSRGRRWGCWSSLPGRRGKRRGTSRPGPLEALGENGGSEFVVCDGLVGDLLPGRSEASPARSAQPMASAAVSVQSGPEWPGGPPHGARGPRLLRGRRCARARCGRRPPGLRGSRLAIARRHVPAHRLGDAVGSPQDRRAGCQAAQQGLGLGEVRHMPARVQLGVGPAGVDEVRDPASAAAGSSGHAGPGADRRACRSWCR